MNHPHLVGSNSQPSKWQYDALPFTGYLIWLKWIVKMLVFQNEHEF